MTAVTVHRQLAVEAQHEDLAGPRVAADPDLRVQAVDAALGAADHDDDSAGVFVAGAVGRLDRHLGLVLAGHDDQRQHPAQGDRAAALAQVDELAVDRGRRGAPAGRRSRHPPDPAVAGHECVGRRAAPTRPTRTARVVLRAPSGSSIGSRIFQEQLDLLALAGEERRVAQQDVQDQSLVGLRRGLGEGVPVAEVHRDVADLHGGARHLGAEPHRDALVRLDPHDQGVLPQLAGRRRSRRAGAGRASKRAAISLTRRPRRLPVRR